MKQKKTILTLISALTFALASVAANANSALSYWEGTDANGIMVTGEDCPLEVVHETLTFDLPDAIGNDIFQSDRWDAYRNSYTAEYEIHNPSDMSVKAVLSFPFGSYPVYGLQREDDRRPYDDESRYSVTLNNEQLLPEVRYTYTGGQRFDVNEDLTRLKDTYLEDDFFGPELEVHQYLLRFEVDDSSKPDGYYTNATCTLPLEPQKHRFSFDDHLRGISTEGKDLQAVLALSEGGEDVIMTVFGGPIELPEWTFETTEDQPVRETGTCQLTEEKTMTYEEYVIMKRPENSPVSLIDYYNALTEELIHESENEVILPSGDFLESQLMKWYRYTIEVGPGETVINSVSAPAYPSINGSYENPLQEYTYLLSPASLWKQFGSLDVVIRSDEYLISSSPSSFEKTEDGYTAHFEGLPEGELNFSLCVDKSPKHVNRAITWVVIGFMISLVLGFGLLLLVIITVFKALFGKGKK